MKLLLIASPSRVEFEQLHDWLKQRGEEPFGPFVHFHASEQSDILLAFDPMLAHRDRTARATREVGDKSRHARKRLDALIAKAEKKGIDLVIMSDPGIAHMDEVSIRVARLELEDRFDEVRVLGLLRHPADLAVMGYDRALLSGRVNRPLSNILEDDDPSALSALIDRPDFAPYFERLNGAFGGDVVIRKAPDHFDAAIDTIEAECADLGIELPYDLDGEIEPDLCDHARLFLQVSNDPAFDLDADRAVMMKMAVTRLSRSLGDRSPARAPRQAAAALDKQCREDLEATLKLAGLTRDNIVPSWLAYPHEDAQICAQQAALFGLKLTEQEAVLSRLPTLSRTRSRKKVG